MNLRVKNLLIILISIVCISSCKAQQKMNVCAPVADAKSTPERTNPSSLPVRYIHHKNQETQVLFGEQIIATQSIQNQNWLAALLPEQPVRINPQDKETVDSIKRDFGYTITTNRWFACPVLLEKHHAAPIQINPTHANNLVTQSYWSDIFAAPNEEATKFEAPISLGSRFMGKRLNQDWWEVTMPNGQVGFIKNHYVYDIQPRVESDINSLRAHIVETARKFKGSYYIWGGRSAARSGNQKLNNQITGVDCSALIQLSFAAYGLCMPRNSHDQFSAATPISSGRDMQPGDLMFLYNPQRARDGKPFRITHVLMYTGNGKLIEATAGTATFDGIIEHDVQSRLDVSIEGLVTGQKINLNTIDQNQPKQIEYQIFMGTFFSSQAKLQNLRNLALHPEIIIDNPNFNF